MKTTPHHFFTLTLCASFTLYLTLFTHAADETDAVSLPTGTWEVSFNNGVAESVVILDDGTVLVTEPNRSSTGKATVKDDLIEIRFDDDRAEIWSLDSKREAFTVQHWHPISAMPRSMPTIGNAVKNDAKAAALEVHEWGTFTVLQGSNGQVIKWYQAPNQLVDLPPFVRQPIRVFGKSGTRQIGGMDTVRMETPVLYFYPEEKMDVTVSARFPEGRITEIFPPSVRPALGGPTIWHGALLPPDSPERKKVPVADGPSGRHYAAAREVPEAWLFHKKPLPIPPAEKDTPTTGADANPLTLPVAFWDGQIPPALYAAAGAALPPGVKSGDKPAPVEPIDHFIFYRGAGNHSFYELRATQGRGPDNFTLSNRGKATIPKAFALRVSEGRTSWLELDELKVVDYVDGKAINQQAFTFPAPSGPAHEVAGELRTAMIDSLHSEGLTRDEATAMVKTWDNLWFTEPGTRILAILPQQFADEMVPLQITPKPTKIDRVFVARVEMLTREMEQKLTNLLDAPNGTDADELTSAAGQLTDLQLGRYAAGGMERAADLIESQVRARFARLQHAAAEMKKLQAKRD